MLDHEIGCRSHTGCDGDCDCRSFAELDHALKLVVDDVTFQRLTNAIRKPPAPTPALVDLFRKR